MSTNDIPHAKIKHQAHITTPVTGDATLVDDSVALVDDPTALVGGPVTPIENLSVAIVDKPLRVHIKKQR